MADVPRPCPYCESTPILIQDGGRFAYQCSNPECAETGPARKTRKLALEAWDAAANALRIPEKERP